MNPSTKRSTPAAPLSAAAAAAGGPCPALPTSSKGPPKPTAEHASQASFEPGVPGAIVVDTTTLTTDVVAVHPSSREVVLGGPGGKPFAVACGPEVRNFDQIHVGDRVEAVVTKEFAYAMASESDPPDTGGSSVITLSPRGAQPGAVMAKVKQVTAAVIAIDLEHHKATLEFPGGQTQTVEVRPDVDLSERKVGEKVVIRLTDSVALRVEKPQQQPQ